MIVSMLKQVWGCCLQIKEVQIIILWTSVSLQDPQLPDYLKEMYYMLHGYFSVSSYKVHVIEYMETMLILSIISTLVFIRVC